MCVFFKTFFFFLISVSFKYYDLEKYEKPINFKQLISNEIIFIQQFAHPRLNDVFGFVVNEKSDCVGIIQQWHEYSLFHLLHIENKTEIKFQWPLKYRFAKEVCFDFSVGNYLKKKKLN